MPFKANTVSDVLPPISLTSSPATFFVLNHTGLFASFQYSVLLRLQETFLKG